MVKEDQKQKLRKLENLQSGAQVAQILLPTMKVMFPGDTKLRQQGKAWGAFHHRIANIST